MRKTCVKPVKNRLDAGPHSEPPTGIDPVTSFLPRTRSTTELGGQRVNTLPEVSAPNKSARPPVLHPRKPRDDGDCRGFRHPGRRRRSPLGRGCDEGYSPAVGRRIRPVDGYPPLAGKTRE